MKLTFLFACSVCLLVAVACGGGDDDSGGDDASNALFDPANADSLAHDALPAAAALGEGWDLTATDNFDDQSADEEFLAMAQKEEACQDIADLAALGDIMGSTDPQDLTAGRAKAEFERAGGAIVPANVEVEVNIADSVAEIQGGWNVARPILQSEDTTNCISALMAATMADQDPTGLLDVELKAVDPPAEAPGDGVAIAFSMSLKAGPINLDALLGLYQWPYSNSLVQVVIFGSLDDLPPAEFTDIINAVDESVTAAARP